MRKIYTFLVTLLTLCGVVQAQTTYLKILSEDDLVAGSTYLMVNEDAKVALGAISSTTTPYGTTVSVTISDGSITINDEAVDVLTLGGTAGKWTLASSLANGYIAWTSGNSLRLQTEVNEKAQWAISFSNGDVTLINVSDNARVLSYNASSPRFATYGNTNQKRVQLYRVDNTAPDEVAKPRISPATGTYYSAQEVTISAVEGAKIYYTTNGSTPTSSSNEYTAPFSVTETTTVKAVAVKGQNSSDVVESVITIETLQTQTIAEILKAGATEQASTTATVMGITKTGVLIGDGTGYIYVHINAAPEVAVGDVVAVSGKVSAYGGCLQFSNTTITKTGTAAVNYPTATVLDGAAFDALVAAPAVTFVKVSGTMTSVGNYNNFSIEGATATGSILAAADMMTDIAVSDNVTVTGFFVYQSSNNKYGNIVATKVEKTGSAQIPELNTLADAKKTVTKEGEFVQLNVTDVLVTYVNGKNVFLFDGTDGLLIYGENKDIKAGDKISGSIKGQLVIYQGLTEISNATYDCTVTSSDNDVVPQAATVSEIMNEPKNYESELVVLEGLTPQASALENKNILFLDEDESGLIVRDKFNALSNYAFNTLASYEVTGIVSIFEDQNGTTVQLNPRDEGDIVNPEEDEWETPEAAWSVESVHVTLGDAVEASFSTNSDGAVTYESSNTDVATVNEQGVITIVGAGTAKITATVAATAAFKGATAVLEIFVTSGDADGSLAHPYSVGDAMARYNPDQASEKVWVKGYIIASADASMNKLVKEGGEAAVASNIVLADAADESETASMMPVALANKSAARAALNLKDNADLLGKQVWVYGTIEKYFSVAGVKNVTNWSLDGTTEGNPEEALPVITPATGTYETAQQVSISVAEGSVIYYTLDGTEPTAQTGTLYSAPFTVEETTTVKAIAVTGDKVSKVVTSVITISQGQEDEGYTKIADLKADATATKTAVTYNAQDVLVTYVNGSSVYVTDGTDAMLLYGTNSGIAAGNRISAKVQGDLYLYNGLTEIAIKSISDLTVLSEDNEVTAQEVQIADLLANVKAYENELIVIKDVTPNAEAWASRNITFVDESENQIALRDNWNIANGLTFDPKEAYDITGFVAIYTKGESTTIQIYPRSKDDILKVSESELQIPEAAWSVESVQVKVGDAVEAAFSTNSDGAVSYVSSNPEVATVNEQGVITIVGVGPATITATVAKTNTFKDASAELVVAVTTDADGSIGNPYTIGDVQALCALNQSSEKVWVMGYIIGSADGAFNENKLVKEGGENAIASNFVLADAADEAAIANMIPVALPNGKVREALNLKDNAALLGQQVWVYGTIEKYFSVAGVKSVSDFSFDGLTAIKSVDAENAAAKVIYNIAGQRVQNLNKAGI